MTCASLRRRARIAHTGEARRRDPTAARESDRRLPIAAVTRGSVVAPQRRMLAERRREIAEHRVRLAGHRHQIRGRAPTDDTCGHFAQLGGCDPHMEGRADVEAHREAMQPGHQEIFQARPLELRRRSKHFRADEAGDVVDDHPAPGLALNVARDTVGACFQRHHVDPLGRSVRHRRPLAGLEIERVETAGEIEDAVNVESDHSDQRPAGAGEALESNVYPRLCLCVALLDDVGEHAEASRQVEPSHDLFEQLFEPDDGVDFVCGGVQANDDVAAAVCEAVEDREQDLFLVVTRAVGLNPRTEMARRADAVGQRVEQAARDGAELVVGHDLRDSGDDFAARARRDDGGPTRGRRLRGVWT